MRCQLPTSASAFVILCAFFEAVFCSPRLKARLASPRTRSRHPCALTCWCGSPPRRRRGLHLAWKPPVPWFIRRAISPRTGASALVASLAFTPDIWPARAPRPLHNSSSPRCSERTRATGLPRSTIPCAAPRTPRSFRSSIDASPAAARWPFPASLRPSLPLHLPTHGFRRSSGTPRTSPSARSPVSQRSLAPCLPRSFIRRRSA